jgi:hypothetical protein
MNRVIEKNGNDTTAYLGGLFNFLLCRDDIVAGMK